MSPTQISKWLRNVEKRAKQKGVPFDLEVGDIQVPMYCPVLGFELQQGTGCSHDASPTIDRIVPELGYTKGNVIVISQRANRLKADGTLDELRKIGAFYQQLRR